MSARVVAWAVAASLVAVAARGDEPASATCDRTPVAGEEPRAFVRLLAPPRTHELWVSTAFLGDWASRRSVTPAFDLGVEGVLPLDDVQRKRLGVHLGLLLGHFGDDRGSWIGLDVALRYRHSFTMTDFVDAYALAQLGATFAVDEVRGAARPGAGLGVRVFRGVALEATADDVISLSGPFASGARAGVGMTIALGGDLCVAFGGCERPDPPTPIAKPLTCTLYAQARSICAKPDRERLCAAVVAAMDADATGSRPNDTGAFLGAVADAVHGTAFEGPMTDLRALHKKLFDEVYDPDPAKGTRAAERIQAQTGGWLKEHCSYEPTAIELRDSLGCEPDGKPTRECRVPPECDAAAITR